MMVSDAVLVHSMKPKPTSLVDLRAKAMQGYAWRNKAGRVVTEDERAEMQEDERAKFSYSPDPKLVEKLVKAEKAEAQRVYEERAS
jgi:hypothetical protein